MTSALVGYSGFVGSNLAKKHDFTFKYNTSNISELIGRHHGLVVFSAAKAEKWRINQNPEADLVHIEELEQVLANFTTDQLVLISTVDVYKDPVGVDEESPVETDGLHAYGAHRRRLEQFAIAQHPGALILRLPGLFGSGIKKNVIFDLIHGNNLSSVHCAGLFQYYNLAHLWNDVQTSLTHQLDLVNLAVEPVRTDEIARSCFGMEFANEPDGVKPGSYDMRSKYAELFGGADGYLRSKPQTIRELKEFVARERSLR